MSATPDGFKPPPLLLQSRRHCQAGKGCEVSLCFLSGISETVSCELVIRLDGTSSPSQAPLSMPPVRTMDDSQQMASAGHSATPGLSQSTPQGIPFMSPPRRKERKNPSVTPRRFRRFFGSLFADAMAEDGGENTRSVLNDLPGSSLNRQSSSTPTKRKVFGQELLASSPTLPVSEPHRKRSRLAPAEHLFSDENVSALQHRVVGSSSSVPVRRPITLCLSSYFLVFVSFICSSFFLPIISFQLLTRAG